jgi:hypothetical protein
VFFYLEDRERTLDTPTDKFMLSLTAFTDELEREKARQRTYDAMIRKARAGHVTGGRVFGYDNEPVLGPDGHRSHVERRINEREAAVVRRIFELCASDHGVRAIAKLLNGTGEPAPRAQQGRPVAWSQSSVWECLRRPLYRGEVVWNQTRKRDRWGQKQQQQPRESAEWIRLDRPHLRIVSEHIWRAAHARLDGAREDYVRRNAGRTWGRPTDGTESKYLLTGLAQCGLCHGGLFVHSRAHGTRRGFFYACTSYHLRGREVCDNRQLLPMDATNRSVLDTFREDLLNPLVIERALSKLEDRLAVPADEVRVSALASERQRIQGEIARLTAALAAGGGLASIVGAIREREQRLETIADELQQSSAAADALSLPLDVIMPEVRLRLSDWQAVLVEESTQARQMLRTLLRGRLVFTPDLEQHACDFVGEGDRSEVFRGLVTLPKALASPTGFDTYGRMPFSRQFRAA